MPRSSQNNPARPPRRGGRRTQAAHSGRRRDPAALPVVGFVSLGCAKNLVDSEKVLGQIAESGAVITTDESVADTMVVNTCGFLQSSRQEALDVIGALAERKRRGTLQRIVVVGCLVQRDGERLLEEVPEIDALVGVNNRADVAAAVWGRYGPGDGDGATAPRAPSAATDRLPSAVADRGPVVSRPTASSGPGASSADQGLPISRMPRADLYLGDYHPQPWSDQGRLRLTPRHYAYVRISEGCNQKCTFCTIPSIRGPMHGKTPDELVAECRELIADGARELILIGQDTTSYGADLGYEPGLAGLLRMLNAACDGARWLRLMYAYPSVFTTAMIDAVAECERVVKYIDLPLQHINDHMLRAMGRRVTRAQTEALLAELRRRIPGVTIRTTFIVGFPGETEAEFVELLAFVRDFGFEAVGTFTFSLEPDTPSGRMHDQLDEAVKRERYQRLMLAQQEVAFAAARRRIGAQLDVVVDTRQRDRCVARHAGQAPEVDAACLLRRARFEPGELMTVRCVAADGYDLVVEPERVRLPSAGAGAG